MFRKERKRVGVSKLRWMVVGWGEGGDDLRVSEGRPDNPIREG